MSEGKAFAGKKHKKGVGGLGNNEKVLKNNKNRIFLERQAIQASGWLANFFWGKRNQTLIFSTSADKKSGKLREILTWKLFRRKKYGTYGPRGVVI